MQQQTFFSTQSPRSAVKTDIVTKYFGAWSSVISKHKRALAYVDLFAGSGVYEDGVESTPIRILRLGIENEKLRQKLITVFNDVDPGAIASLRAAAQNLPGIENLLHRPRFLNAKVGDQNRLAESIGIEPDVPTLSFIDPFGYLGVTQSLIEESLGGWGSELVLFFNYNQINRAINISSVAPHIDALFTPPIASELRELINCSSAPWQRENAILRGITKSLNPLGSRCLLFFRFKAVDKDRTSHYIVHVSGHKRGYFIMRDIMAGSSSMRNGIPLFEWSPDSAQQLNLDLGIEGDVGIPELKLRLSESMQGLSVKVRECYEKTTFGTPYLRKHFTRAINEMESEGSVIVSKPREERMRKGQITLGSDLTLKFPHRG